MSGGFKRSGLFGLLGVFVVAALAIVIAMTMGQGEANPKLALGLIFGVIAIFCAGLFAFQRSDLERAAGSSARAGERAAAEGGRTIENPMTIAFRLQHERAPVAFRRHLLFHGDAYIFRRIDVLHIYARDLHAPFVSRLVED